MTTLGIQWLSHLENVRHNQAVEKETTRSNKAKEDLTGSQISLDVARLNEQSTHNRAVENLEGARNQITAQYNRGQLINQHNQIAENKRHNLASENENFRHNYVTEDAKNAEITINGLNSLIRSLIDAAKLAI